MNDTTIPTLDSRVTDLENRLTPQPPCSPDHAAGVARWRADMIADGSEPPDGLRDDRERAAFAAARSRVLGGGL